MSILISTIVLNWNRADLLKITLDSYFRTISVPYEIFIVDNFSQDGSKNVINFFCTKFPRCKAILLQKNIGGEAINVALKYCKGKLIHISENDIEYIHGWDEKVISLFENFPRLGQLSLFAPVPTNEEVWVSKPAALRHSGTHIIYEALGNVGTTSVLRRELFDRGLHIKNITSTSGSFVFPDDGKLSTEVKKKGYMVAWADSYLVRNIGHSISELTKRQQYYEENYKSKKWVKISGLRDRIKEWEERKKVSRRSILFPYKNLLAEITQPSLECPHPMLWSMIDGRTSEVETLELLYSIVRLTKPMVVLETGTWHGYASEAMGLALKNNGRGKIVSLEKEKKIFNIALKRIKDRQLEDVIHVVNKESLEYNFEGKIDLLFLDSNPEILESEFIHFSRNLKSGSIVIFHNIRRDKFDNILRKHKQLQGFYFSTPRGIGICIVEKKLEHATRRVINLIKTLKSFLKTILRKLKRLLLNNDI